MILFKKISFVLLSLVTLFCINSTHVFAQKFTKQDSLRGFLNEMRACYDVYYYDLMLDIDIEKRYIKGHNTISFKVVNAFETMQVDLFENMQIEQILFGQQTLAFKREGNAFWVKMPRMMQKDELASITVLYGGHPRTAPNAPWDGGFSWKKDKMDRPWVGVSCEGLGASVWFPNKDHLSDEPDSMRMCFTVPTPLFCVSNGVLKQVEKLRGNKTRYDWFVSYPINNYNVTLNIAHYAHFSDVFKSEDNSTYALDYYVLDYNLEKAKEHFKQVKPMLACYERLFGKYPFANDGYALVETPYWGMEHQGAIAYGNDYKNNNFGFDYIIIHESGHEYFGNSLSVNDHAEMWIHESFCTYAEALYVECLHGYERMIAYLATQKRAGMIKNTTPMLGPLHVNYDDWGHSDIYYKGTQMLHTLRRLVNDDALWFATIKDFTTHFERKNLTTEDVISFFSSKLNKKLSPFFDQYLKHTKLPVLEYDYKIRSNKATLAYRWKTDVAGFEMGIDLVLADGKTERLQATNEWKSIEFASNKSYKPVFAQDMYVLFEQKK